MAHDFSLSSFTGIALGFVVASAALAACGPPPPATGPEVGAPTAQQTAVTPPIATPTATASAMPTAAPSVTPTAAPAAAGPPSTPLMKSALVGDVAKLGIDLKKTPTLESIPIPQKKKLMGYFVKALGFEGCNGCHVEGDFKKETRNLKVARGMWNHFVKDLRDDKGGPIFCDSCHSGKSKVLNRGDKDAVKKFMESDYEGKLTRADKKESACSTCHGEAFEAKIIDKLWGVAAAK